MKNIRPRTMRFLLFASCLCAATTARGDLVSTIDAWIPTTGLNLTLNSAVFDATATSSNLSSLETSIVNNWVMPNGLVSGSTATVTALESLGSMGLSSAQLQPYLNLVSSGQFALVAGDQVFQLNWTLNNPGLGGAQSFSTLGFQDASGHAVFEPWLFQTPILDQYISTVNKGSSVHFSTANVFYTTTTGDASITINCSATPVQCNVLTSNSSTPLWGSTITHAPINMYTMGGMQCCSSVINYGFDNGFKSITIGADGFTLGVTGNFGWAGTTSSLISACCVPEPSSLIMMALALPVLGMWSLRTRLVNVSSILRR